MTSDFGRRLNGFTGISHQIIDSAGCIRGRSLLPRNLAI
jgi:hypothetical protein